MGLQFRARSGPWAPVLAQPRQHFRVIKVPLHVTCCITSPYRPAWQKAGAQVWPPLFPLESSPHTLQAMPSLTAAMLQRCRGLLSGGVGNGPGGRLQATVRHVVGLPSLSMT